MMKGGFEMDDKEVEQLIKKAKADYMKAYRLKNGDKIKSINQKHWLKKITQESAKVETGK